MVGHTVLVVWSAGGIQWSNHSMNDHGKSDRRIVPKKRSNKDRGAPRSAEGVEERRLAKGNSATGDSRRTSSRFSALGNSLDGIRKVAKGDHEAKFTTLWHHVHNTDRLRESYFRLKRSSAAGVDGVTWQAYGTDLEARLDDLSDRLGRGGYRPAPVKRIHIPKPDGRQRPIGIPTLEDKVVQRATVDVLNAIYESDFLGFSYGFRPGRDQHQALDALWTGLTRKKVNWVLDADIRGFFDTIDHGWLVKFLEHRIADARVIRHIKKWLYAGVLEDGAWKRSEGGTPQGGCISPLLANIYLHYVLDLWVQRERQTMHGDVVIVRYADDFVVGFEHRAEAEQFLAALRARFAKFHLELHPEKTRLLEFGRHARRRFKRGRGRRPETFGFLGFTHIASQTRRGYYTVQRQTESKRLRAKLKDLLATLRARLHDPIPKVGRWLQSVLRGHYRYYGIPGNYGAMDALRYQLLLGWKRILRRRSQRTRVLWSRMDRLIQRYLPRPTICRPWPSL